MLELRRSTVPLLLAALLVGCGGPRNATLGTWEGTSARQLPGAQPERYKLAIDVKNATLYDKTGTAVGSFPVTFPNPQEAVVSGFLGMSVDVTAQADGSAKVVGLNMSATPAGSSQRSSDVFHRASP